MALTLRYCVCCFFAEQSDTWLKLCRYVFCCSNSHNVAPKGKYIAFVSAEVETENPEAELEAGLALLGPIDEKIIDMYDMYEPVNDCTLDNCYISKVSHGALDGCLLEI